MGNLVIFTTQVKFIAIRFLQTIQPYLAHELGDDTVESGALVAEALLTGAKGTEVLSSLGNHVGVELQKQSITSRHEAFISKTRRQVCSR